MNGDRAMRAVSIGAPEDLGALESLARAFAAMHGDVESALRAAGPLALELPPPGDGSTALLWSALASIGAVDLTLARAVEPHLDAVAILRQAGLSPQGGAWGVYAAERSGMRVDAETDGRTVRLTGTKPWCSLADRLDRALVTAVQDGRRRLFAIDLRDSGVRVLPQEWPALGLAAIPSGPIRLDSVEAVPVGGPGWYLERPGFAWGGIGVAAVWFGGAVGVARALTAAAVRRPPDQLALAAIGRADRGLHAARTVLADAARAVDGGGAAGADGALLAARARGVVAAAAEDVLTVTGHALGPAPLTMDAEHARRVADLTVYLRQHHAERDDAALGETVLASGRAW